VIKARPGVSRWVKAGLVLSSPVCLWQALAINHSRDRHGSIFDGAEWDRFRSGLASCVGACLAESGPVKETSLVVGTVASSRTRRGMDGGCIRSC
jgi:hypothetical protein